MRRIVWGFAVMLALFAFIIIIRVIFPISSQDAKGQYQLWDFSHSKTLEAVHWPARYASLTIWVTPEQQNIDLVLPSGNRTVHEDVKAMVVRNGQKVQVVQIYFKPESLDNATRRALNLMDNWHLQGSTELRTWTARISTARLEGMNVEDRNFQFPAPSRKPAPVTVHVNWALHDRVWRVELDHLISDNGND